jgi:glycosyltransferase involved in cell wall biosynthesis
VLATGLAGVIFFEDTRFDTEALAFARNLDVIVAGSTWNAEVLRSLGLTNVRVALQGIDPSVFHPAPNTGQLSDRFVVFSGGKLEFRKGQDIVVAAFRTFRARHPEALLVTAWHNHWPHLITDLSLAGHVRGIPAVAQDGLRIPEWLASNGIPTDAVLDVGATPHALMGQIIREADLAIFPNRCEGGTNLVAMECMASGVPTVVSANTGHLDIVRMGGCIPLERQRRVPRPTRFYRGTEGWGESDVEELVEAMERVYADRAAARRLAVEGAARMAQLTWSNQVGVLLDVLAPLFEA